ncbi:MAG: tRNA (N6-isopentenyl adenosine(37)-C2)-methylthiotransferase MiaB, partial [Bacilli bacterium]|nr:tRNA (N6-isopentenyl adenosine(37)-C2)-methylthiotransferase MiaB [Bacilli bacterium]
MNLPDMNEAKKRHKETTEYIYTDVVKNNNYKDKKYFIKTYGCQMNVHDSEEISGLLENLGYTRVESELDADLIILNTCAIRENAHDKVFGFLGRCKHIKKEKKDVKLVLCGCMAQEKSVVDEIMSKHKYLSLIHN